MDWSCVSAAEPADEAGFEVAGTVSDCPFSPPLGSTLSQ